VNRGAAIASSLDRAAAGIAGIQAVNSGSPMSASDPGKLDRIVADARPPPRSANGASRETCS